MAFDTLIFTIDDVRAVRSSTSRHIEDFDVYAQEVQRNYLEKILGAKLYAAMISNPTETRFVNLINGETYNDSGIIIFRGVKLYCSYLWLHLFNSMGAVKHTPIGNAIFKDQEANQGEASQYNRSATAHYINSADGLEGSIIDYLSFRLPTYPEFSESNQIEQAGKDNITFKVVGSTWTAPESLL